MVRHPIITRNTPRVLPGAWFGLRLGRLPIIFGRQSRLDPVLLVPLH